MPTELLPSMMMMVMTTTIQMVTVAVFVCLLFVWGQGVFLKTTAVMAIISIELFSI